MRNETTTRKGETMKARLKEMTTSQLVEALDNVHRNVEQMTQDARFVRAAVLAEYETRVSPEDFDRMLDGLAL